MGDNQRLDEHKRLTGRRNFLSWLTAITILLGSLGLGQYLKDGNWDANSAGHRKAVAIVTLNVENENIVSHIAHVMRDSTLPQIMQHLTNAYCPTPTELLHEFTALQYTPGTPVEDFFAQAETLLNQMHHRPGSSNTPPSSPRTPSSP